MGTCPGGDFGDENLSWWKLWKWKFVLLDIFVMGTCPSGNFGNENLSWWRFW